MSLSYEEDIGGVGTRDNSGNAGRVSLRGAVSAAGSQAGRLKVIVWRSPDSALTVSLQCDFHIWIEMNSTGAAQSKSTSFSMKTSCRFSKTVLPPTLHASGHTICAVPHADPPAAYCALNIRFFTKKNQNPKCRGK